MLVSETEWPAIVAGRVSCGECRFNRTIMRSSLFWFAALAAALQLARSSSAAEGGDQMVWLSEQARPHDNAPAATVTPGVPQRDDEAFRQGIHGTNFTVTVTDLSPGKYTVRIGLIEVQYTAPGQRVFDITCGKQVLGEQSRYFCRRRRDGKSLLCHRPGGMP